MEVMSQAEAMRTGPEALDAEHRVQVALLHALTDAATRKARGPKVQELLDQFVSYSEMHFASEELLMRVHDYPGLDQHHADHVTLSDKFRKLRADFASDPATLTPAALVAHRSALVGHILTRDEQFDNFLKHLREAAY